MIEGFEEYTAELTDKEIPICNRIAAGLKNRIGKENAITNLEIRQRLSKEGMIVSDAGVRKIVEYIRQNNIVPKVCSTSKGYFVAKNNEELSAWIKSMKQRIGAMQCTLHSVIKGTDIKDF
ncbi:MAG TPA: hypothetical protein DGG95_08305 [Cytophagales bacterium]|jgi:hypothetical protein|nr:hypothetical protein [Cytophagales bacterium]